MREHNLLTLRERDSRQSAASTAEMYKLVEIIISEVDCRKNQVEYWVGSVP